MITNNVCVNMGSSIKSTLPKYQGITTALVKYEKSDNFQYFFSKYKIEIVFNFIFMISYPTKKQKIN